MADRAGARIIFEDEHLRVVHRPGGTPYTLVTFSLIGFKPAGKDFWWRAACAAGDVNALGVVALAPNWFPAISMASAISAMRAFLRAPVVTFGYSHGGYGALKYARALDAAGVVSISPQYSINPTSLPIADFFKPFFNPVLHQDMEIRAADQSGVVALVWDPLFQRDDKHVRHIIEQGYQPTELIRLPHLGHRMMRIFDDHAAVAGLFEACLGGAGFNAERRRCRHLRRNSSTYACGFARQLLAARRAACAVRLLEAAGRNTTMTEAENAQVTQLLEMARLTASGGSPAPGPAADAERREERLVGRLLASP